MSEKDKFIETWEREFQTTMKVLRAYPSDKLSLRPHERSKSAGELAWAFVVEEKMIDDVIKGQIDFQNVPKPPATMSEILSAYEKSHHNLVTKARNLPEEDFNKMVGFMVAPRTPGDMRRGDILWMMLHDMIHHRGQFSVYLRMAGGKVPSIYGPSADEPWM